MLLLRCIGDSMDFEVMLKLMDSLDPTKLTLPLGEAAARGYTSLAES